MWFWWFMFFCNLLYPVVMILGGYYMWKHCPKSINSIIGYRTGRSMKNMDTWQFAHEDFGKRWWKLGWIVLIPDVLVQLPLIGKSEDVIGNVGLLITFIGILVLILPIFQTEKALKETFDDQGNRRH